MQLLFAIVDTLNPSVSRGHWQKIAEAVGGGTLPLPHPRPIPVTTHLLPGITGESARQRIITLKRKHLGNTRAKLTDTPGTPVKKDGRAAEHDFEEVATPLRRSSARKRTAIRYVEPDENTEGEDDGDDIRGLESPTKKVKIEDVVEFPAIQIAEEVDVNESG